jgi:hypothetical protein
VKPKKARWPKLLVDIDGDRDWLVAIDKKIRVLDRYWDTQFNREAIHETFNDERRLTAREMARVFKIVEDENAYTLTPCNCYMGFRKGFDVCAVEQFAPGVPFEITHLLRFSEKQLPEGWKWDRLSRHFTSAAKLKLYKMDPVHDEAYYEY